MKIIFINNLRLPTEKAYGQSIASMAVALAAAGEQVRVIGNQSTRGLDFFEFYNLPQSFEFTALDNTKLLPHRLGRVADYFNRVLFLVIIWRQHFSLDSVFITRQPEIAWLLSVLGYEVVFDAHRFPERWGGVLIWLIKKVKFVSANSYGTASAFERAGFYRLKVLPNGVDLSRFVNQLSTKNSQFTALYLGHLYNWKGIRAILDAAVAAPAIKFKIAGGPEREKKDLETEVKKRHLQNVEFVGVITPVQVPIYLSEADALIYSGSANSVEARLYTSPIKLFEYLAAGRPIVAADLPSVREIVSEQEVNFYSVGDGNNLAAVLQSIRDNPEMAAARASAGRRLVNNYTWDNRAAKLLSEIKLSKPPFLAVGAFLADYPRNQLLLRSLASLTNLEVKNYYHSWWPAGRLTLKLWQRREVKTLLVQPASNFSPVLWLTKTFRTAPVLADAFTSLYDTLISDRQLVQLGSLKARYYFGLDKLLTSSADHLLFDTVEHQRFFEETFNQGHELRATIVPVVIDLRLFDQIPAARPINQSQTNILFYGKYIPLQGVEIIVEAANLLKDDEDIHFTLLGSGQTHQLIKNLAQKYKLKNITFHPKVNYSQLISLIKSADILLGIFGKSDKAMRVIPNKVIESLAAGRPLITAATPAMERFFTDQQDLFFIPAGDPAALADKIIQLKNHPELAKQVSQSGREVVKKHFTLGVMTNNLSEFISQI